MNYKVRIVLSCVLILGCSILISLSYILRDTYGISTLKNPFEYVFAKTNDTRYGYISGDYNNEFNKGSYVTRAEIASMIFKIENLEYGYDYVYSDTEDNVYVGIISSVIKRGYMSANNDEFFPDNYLTRSQFAKIINSIIDRNKTVSMKKIRTYENSYRDIENDDNKIDIIKLYEYGIIDDNAKEKFRPYDFVAKEEAIVMLNKIYGYYEGDLLKMIDLYNQNPYKDINENYWAYEDIVRATIGLEEIK